MEYVCRGDGNDGGGYIGVDANEAVYVAGGTATDSGWAGPIVDPYSDAGDAFVVKLGGVTGAMGWVAFLGGPMVDSASALTARGNGNVFVTGSSSDTWGSPVRPYNDDDAFVARLNGSGAIIYNTFLGSSNGDDGRAIAADASENAYVIGGSFETWEPPVNPYSGGGDIFVAKLDSLGVLQWNTFVGSVDYDEGGGVVVDSSGSVYLSGQSEWTWGSPFRPHSGFVDDFAARLSSSGALVWNAFVPSVSGPYSLFGPGIAASGNGNVVITGTSTESWGSPIRPFPWGTLRCAFVAKIADPSRDDLVGTWDGLGVYGLNSGTGGWMPLGPPAEMIACGDLFGDGRDDLFGVWTSLGGLWTRNSADGVWTYLCSAARHLAAGDMNGDGRTDLLGTWDGIGVFYRDSMSGQWVLIAPQANKLAAGDLDGDGKADLIGLWPGLGEIWFRSSLTGAWSFFALCPSGLCDGRYERGRPDGPRRNVGRTGSVL